MNPAESGLKTVIKVHTKALVRVNTYLLGHPKWGGMGLGCTQRWSLKPKAFLEIKGREKEKKERGERVEEKGGRKVQRGIQLKREKKGGTELRGCYVEVIQRYTTLGVKVRDVTLWDWVASNLSMEWISKNWSCLSSTIAVNFSLTIMPFRQVLISWKFSKGDFQEWAIVCLVALNMNAIHFAVLDVQPG